MTVTHPGSCSALSLAAGEPLAGTASRARGYLMLQHGGPWGVKAMRDAVFPGPGGAPSDLGPRLTAALEPLGITPLLVRRHGQRHGALSPAVVMLVVLDGLGGRGVRTSVDSLTDVADWDLVALVADVRSGSVPDGWEELGTQYLVCTHARRDACCGRLGRPLVAALASLDPERTWEASHLGGHRLAANTLVVPDGVVYGRLTADDAAGLAGAHDAGRLVVGSLRGRAALAPPVQVAEIAVRQAAGADGAGDVALLGVEDVPPSDGALDGDPAEPAVRAVTVSRWSADVREFRVVVETRPGAGGPRPASCGDEPAEPALQQVVVAVEPV